MAEHWPANMIGEKVMAWCSICKRDTPHRIDAVTTDKKAGRTGPCLNQHRNYLTKKQQRSREEHERARQSPSLFGDQP